MEIWGEELEDWIREFCNRIWRGEEWPKESREGVIVPIVKKGEGEKVEEYRGVTLMSTAYKLYAAVLAERMREKIERKELIPHNQTGFRKGMGIVNNIYTLNFLINRQLRKKGRKLVALFVDIKAAFDSVDREILIGIMKEMGVRERLTERVEQVVRETRSRVRVGKDVGESFWTARRVRQRSPLSPMLFNMLLADIEEEMGRVKWGELSWGKEEFIRFRMRMIWYCWRKMKRK